jgi:ribosomal protein L12E/L44/L45/RPP1/RPP2
MTDTQGQGRPHAPMVVVYTANGEMEAHALKSVLEAAGIPAELDIESAAKLFVVTVDGLGAVKIKVPADRAEEARAVLATPAEPIGEEDS